MFIADLRDQVFVIRDVKEIKKEIKDQSCKLF